MQVVPLTRHIGAEIRGLDLSRPVDDADFDRLRDAFHAHSVIVLQDQVIDEQQHIAVSRKFGPLEIHVAKPYLLPSHPEIVVLSNRKRPDGTAEGIEDAGRYWHSDLSYILRPSLGSLLYAHEVPPSQPMPCPRYLGTRLRRPDSTPAMPALGSVPIGLLGQEDQERSILPRVAARSLTGPAALAQPDAADSACPA